MQQTKSINQQQTTQEENFINPFNTILESVLREGAHKLLQQALENEVAEYLEAHKHNLDACGHQQIVRNGYHKERTIVTGLGAISITQPRVHDTSGKKQFTSNILPKYMRRVASVDNLIPVLYLKGISTGDFASALESILGPQASGLSATNVVRLKQRWEDEYKDWNKRSLKDKH
jgi:transposase-like protein